ncbi:MAG: hydroxyacylglutathione hydrolase [Rickettsiales bacterium]|nr:hydroxyacylglutathione hydrolase [Rickettsiales bacterium]
MSNYKIEIIPALADNYIYILIDIENNITICIDPGDHKPVEEFLKQNNLKLDYILNTHHHYDHITGNDALKSAYNCKIYAPLKDKHRISSATDFLSENDVLDIGIFSFDIIETPGNTINHISFHDKNLKILFSGDTIFSSGCARILEGNKRMLFDSLNKLSQIDPSTKIFFAHEYTLKNINFALQFEPNNQDLIAKKTATTNLINNNKPTTPSSLANEMKTNPFFRLHNKEIRKNLGFNSDHLSFKVFQKLRDLKDNY